MLYNAKLRSNASSKLSNSSLSSVSLNGVVATDIYPSPYDILDLDTTATPEAIKKKYKHLSLCTLCVIQTVQKSVRLCSSVIHPDKTKHERAPEAFDLLKKVSNSVVFIVIYLSTVINRRNQS